MKKGVTLLTLLLVGLFFINFVFACSGLSYSGSSLVSQDAGTVQCGATACFVKSWAKDCYKECNYDSDGCEISCENVCYSQEGSCTNVCGGGGGGSVCEADPCTFGCPDANKCSVCPSLCTSEQICCSDSCVDPFCSEGEEVVTSNDFCGRGFNNYRVDFPVNFDNYQLSDWGIFIRGIHYNCLFPETCFAEYSSDGQVDWNNFNELNESCAPGCCVVRGTDGCTPPTFTEDASCSSVILQNYTYQCYNSWYDLYNVATSKFNGNESCFSDLSCSPSVGSRLGNLEECQFGCLSTGGPCNHRYCFDGDHDGYSNESNCWEQPARLSLDKEDWLRTDYRYELFEDAKTWTDAQDDCVSRGGNLVQVTDWAVDEKTGKLNTEVRDLLNETFFGKEYWIGLNDISAENNFVWPKGNILNPYLRNSTNYWIYTIAFGQEPNNLANEDCVVVKENGLWNDDSCSDTNSYVCEFDYTFDCDDSSLGINPSASEICGNGIDDNCDGIIDNPILCIYPYCETHQTEPSCFCAVNPSAVGCGGSYCALNPTLPECVGTFCALNPAAPECVPGYCITHSTDPACYCAVNPTVEGCFVPVLNNNASWSNLKTRQREIPSADKGDTVLMNSNLSSGNLNYTVKYSLLGFLIPVSDISKFVNKDSSVPLVLGNSLYDLFFTVDFSVFSEDSKALKRTETNNSKPVVRITSPSKKINITSGGTVSFSADVYDEDDFLKVTWDFGDGKEKTFENYAQAINSSSSLSVNHSYLGCGVFNVKLKVEETNRSQLTEDFADVYVYKDGICVFPVISSPENGKSNYVRLIGFNAGKSFVTNCSVGPRTNKNITVGNLNCTYIHAPGQKVVNTSKYNISVEWAIAPPGLVYSGSWGSSLTSGTIQDFYWWFEEEAQRLALLKLTFRN